MGRPNFTPIVFQGMIGAKEIATGTNLSDSNQRLSIFASGQFNKILLIEFNNCFLNFCKKLFFTGFYNPPLLDLFHNGLFNKNF
jgi:hypothetical protein